MPESRATGLGIDQYRDVLARLLDLMRARFGSQLLAVALFGSAARGEARPSSDLDMLVVHRGDRKALHKLFVDIVLELRGTPEYRALERRGILPEPYPLFMSQERLATTPWILLDVADHGILLHDPEGVLAAKLAALRVRLRELGARKVLLDDGTWYWDLKPDWKPGDVIEL